MTVRTKNQENFVPLAEKQNIGSIVIFGDSLSATNNFNTKSSSFFNNIKDGLLRHWSKLKKFPDGQFTNGAVWVRHFMYFVLYKSYDDAIKKVEKIETRALKEANQYQEADNLVKQKEKIAAHYEKLAEILEKTRDSDLHKLWENDNISGLYANFSAGGSTIYPFTGYWSLNFLEMIKCRVMGFLLPPLKKQVKIFLKEKDKYPAPVIYVWGGANDLITFPKHPSLKQVNKSLVAYKRMLLKLRQQCPDAPIIILNLPDLSKTPRYHTKDEALKKLLIQCVDKFNGGLKKIMSDKNINARLIDVHKKFEEMQEYPEKYGINRKDTMTSCIEKGVCPIHLNGKDKVAPAHGVPFSDDLHPSATVHAELALRCIWENFYETYTLQSTQNEKLITDYDRNTEKFLNPSLLFESMHPKDKMPNATPHCPPPAAGG